METNKTGNEWDPGDPPEIHRERMNHSSQPAMSAETAMTAEQCARRIDNVICRKDKLEPSEDREEYLAEELEAYAAHVREAAQGVDPQEWENAKAEIKSIREGKHPIQLLATDRLETAARKLAEAQRLHDEYRAEGQQYLFHLEGAIETKTAKLAELEKALQEIADRDPISGSCGDSPNDCKSGRDGTGCIGCVARRALASLRAESKEPVD